MQNNISISNLLIIISMFFTFIGLYIYPELFIYSINNYFLNSGDYHIYFLQFFTGTFLHGSILHIFMNGIFIYYFGNIVEALIGKKSYLIFFIFSCIIIGLSLTTFTNTSSVGISGFAMALLTYYTLELKSKNNPEYKGGLTAILINVFIGLHPQISLLGHLVGVIVGFIYYILNKDFFGKEKINYFKKKSSFVSPELENTNYSK